MQTANVLEQINIESDGGHLFAAYRRGELTDQEWFEFTAVEEASRCIHVTGKPYPFLPEAIDGYCRKRAERLIPYDSALAGRLGNWFRALSAAREWNAERVEHYSWCLEKLQPRAAEGAKQALRAAIGRISKLTFPEEDSRIAIAVKRIDAEEREKIRRQA